MAFRSTNPFPTILKAGFPAFTQDDVEHCREQIRQHNAGEVEDFSFEYREKNTSGEYVWIHCRGRVVEWQSDGSASRVLGTDIDITRLKQEEQRRAEENAALHQKHIIELEEAHQRTEAARQVAHLLARQDPLTQLPNRRVFSDEIDHLCSLSNNQTSFAVMIVDLDRFKPVNDLYGLITGDLILRTAAERLLKAVSATGIVARLGGDEFGVILTRQPSDKPCFALSCANAIITTMNDPIQVGGFTVEVGASVGIAVYPEHGTDPHTLFRNADMALYAVKQAERGVATIYSDEMGRKAEAKAILENEVRHAVARDEIQPFFQPIIDLKTGKIQAFEVLARWHNLDLGDVLPDQFIPIIDQFNLMPQFTLSILKQACSFARDWPREIKLSINLTAKEVCDLSTPLKIFRLISEVGFPASRVEIEVTEQALMHDLFTAKQVIMAFRNAGASVVLDDFGAGYAGLGYLRELKFDCIKIDRSFVMTLLRQTESATIVEAMQTLARNLGLKTVAEGVEDERTLEALKKIGCDSAQGYYFSPAVSGSDVMALVGNYQDKLRHTA